MEYSRAMMGVGVTELLLLLVIGFVLMVPLAVGVLAVMRAGRGRQTRPCPSCGATTGVQSPTCPQWQQRLPPTA